MFTVTDPIASRSLETEAGGIIEVQFGRPTREGDDWFTPWRISGLDNDPIESFAGGIDSVQSLMFAMAAVGDRISSHKTVVTYLGSPEIQLLQTELGDTSTWKATVSAPMA